MIISYYSCIRYLIAILQAWPVYMCNVYGFCDDITAIFVPIVYPSPLMQPPIKLITEGPQ